MTPDSAPATAANVQQLVPLLDVTSMSRSLEFYERGLGFTVKNRWIDEGVLRWCWLELGGAALMLQELRPERHDAGVELGAGVGLNFTCRDALALYHEFRGRGLEPERPFVGNRMWVVGLRDPDGYRVYFESFTEVPEETLYSEAEHGRP